MRHKRSRNRLKQKPGHARMFKRNLLTSLLLYEKIRTTKKRASVIAPEVDKLISFAKRNTPHVAIRTLNQTVTDRNASRKVMEVLIQRYAKRDSGLTRTVPAGFRIGDGAMLVDLQLLEGEAVPVVEKTPKAPKTPKTPSKSKASKSSKS